MHSKANATWNSANILASDAGKKKKKNNMEMVASPAASNYDIFEANKKWRIALKSILISSWA